MRAINPWTVCVAIIAAWLAVPACAAETMDCHIGSYRLSDGGMLDIGPSEGKTLRWRRFDGTTGALSQKSAEAWTSSYGWTGRPDAKSVRLLPCVDGSIRFAGMPGKKIRFNVTETTFVSHAVTLAGRLVLPAGNDVVPIVVLIHGAEHDSARQFYALQRMLPAENIGAFVYDKRGTGDSQGAYSQDFDLLADDAVAAMREAKRLAGRRAGRIGYQGGSQGGWVAPLAANRTHVDFVIVSFGLAVSVIDEDQQEVDIEMREKGYSRAQIDNALEVARAAEKVIASGFTEGFEEFDAVRAKYRDASWYRDLHGNYTYFLLPYSASQLRDLRSKFAWGTPFYYDPMPALRSNTTPQLWILGGEDYEAPSAETSRRIKSLIADDLPFTLAIYPRAEHGMTLFEKSAPGAERVSTRFAPRYFEMMRDFVRSGRLTRPYGDAELTMKHLAHP